MNAQTAAKLHAACVTINRTAIEFLAAKHEVPAATILEQLAYGNTRIVSQFKTLTDAALKAAVQMDAEGKISLIAH